ncbi:hypothetical protein RCL_jg4962.t1 [Rhizophagus clarus]|uniref:Uncharacterized protein n=1 Tax=Rhizophagus clarus TaxID=94130 RepID=A0A8H3LAZ8_9GLOM|nr:hypothetical protein RCL_jg4962.t1 [Rhizophagus clarus]
MLKFLKNFFNTKISYQKYRTVFCSWCSRLVVRQNANKHLNFLKSVKNDESTNLKTNQILTAKKTKLFT